MIEAWGQLVRGDKLRRADGDEGSVKSVGQRVVVEWLWAKDGSSYSMSYWPDEMIPIHIERLL